VKVIDSAGSVAPLIVPLIDVPLFTVPVKVKVFPFAFVIVKLIAEPVYVPVTLLSRTHTYPGDGGPIAASPAAF
jgi:hypothetical protein